MLFDVGNLITLGIVFLLLILFRLLDRGNRSLSKLRDYTNQCKKEISAFVEERAAVIKDYGIALDVERKSAAELMRRIQTLTREELAEKVHALSQIDERIRDYDLSLEELVQITSRVQENLNRIRDESSFVEDVGRRLGEAKEKVEYIDNEIDSIDKKMGTIEEHFERENAEALEKAVEEALVAAKSAIAGFESSTQTIEQKIEDQREAVNKLEREREEKLRRSEERFEKLLSQAMDEAGSRADKAEEATLSKLRDQAQERLNHIKTHFEDKIKSVQETVKTKLGEIQEQVKSNREEWKAETSAIEARQKAYSADWKKDMQGLDAFAEKQKQEMINAAQDRLDEYRQAQEEQFRQLSSVANDTSRLEAELRRSMQDAMNRVNGDFTIFGKEIRGTWESACAEFNGKLQVLRDELTSVDRELSGIKERAFENVSQKLKGFEDDFLADLSRRSMDIDRQLAAWQEALDKRLESIAEDSEAKRQKAETRITEEIRKTITAQGEKLVSDLERLKAETAAFEEGIREEMRGADESRKSFNEQLEHELEEVKNAAENEINTKIGQYNLSISDTLRQNQRDLEAQIQGVISDTKEQISGMEKSTEDFRTSIEEWQTQYNTRMRDLDDSMEEARHRSRELAAENDERVAMARSSLEEIRREITTQAKLFDRTDSLKAELDHYVEDISGNINRLLQFKNEITHFENQFTQIKRLAEDVNAKMTRFLSEQRRIEVMENDFTRLLQTSQSVEEKLAEVSNSDDILQTMQVQIRRLDDVIKETEEKYQRIERKNKTLQETNDGIDRNFKALQSDEQSIKRLEDTISGLKTDMETIRDSVETLSAENEMAREAAEKLSTLDETVKWMEKRITEMNIARESLARLASELQNLDKDAQDQLNLTRSLLNREEGKLAGRAAKKSAGKAADEGAPPPRDRENIIRLKRQGWSIDEIARSMKISKGEVELILELGPKDI